MRGLMMGRRWPAHVSHVSWDLVAGAASGILQLPPRRLVDEHKLWEALSRKTYDNFVFMSCQLLVFFRPITMLYIRIQLHR